MVAYLLEYYSQHAMKSPDWMTTVSKALPLLFKYNYGLLLIFIHLEKFVKFTVFYL